MNCPSEAITRQLADFEPCFHAAIQRTALDDTMQEAVSYAALGGGKRIRPFCILSLGAALGVDREILLPAAIAVEMVHAYSLVHDDLPAMDDDTLRRGQPTCHIAFDEATAILAGDALQTLAFEILSTATDQLNADQQLSMLHTLAKASGHHGMAGGQYLDVQQQANTLTDLQNLHHHKTGKLIEAAVALGYLASESCSAAQRQALDTYAFHIGIAFQIQDDILDATQTSEILGKTQQKDLHQGKFTYVQALGLDGAVSSLKQHHTQALTALQTFPTHTDLLECLANHIVQRIA